MIDLSSGADTIETTLSEPGILYFEVASAFSGTPLQGSNAAISQPRSPVSVPDRSAPDVIHLGAAIAPWKLQPSVPRPVDFDTFWNAKLRALNGIPMNSVLTPVETGKNDVETYTVQLDSFGSHVQGYLAKPSKEGKFPSLFGGIDGRDIMAVIWAAGPAPGAFDLYLDQVRFAISDSRRIRSTLVVRRLQGSLQMLNSAQDHLR